MKANRAELRKRYAPRVAAQLQKTVDKLPIKKPMEEDAPAEDDAPEGMSIAP